MAAMQTLKSPSGDTVPLPANCVSVCPPSKDMLTPGRFAVNDLDKMEAITQPLYSYQLYPAAGAATLVFFQNPASGTVTREDTNMELAGQLPAPQKFLIQGIGVDFISGLAASTLGAASVNSAINDFNAVMQRGYLSLIIGSKNYLNVTALKTLPMRSYVDGMAGLSNATTPAAALASVIQTYKISGNVFSPTPLLLEASQNFRVEISYPGGVVAVPSANATSRIGVTLYGTLYRSPQ
jgi:hypothetical protein